MRPLLEGDRAVSRRNWPQFAFTVAEALIDAGVRCVIAAGWAVDDLAASVFAARFYDSLLRGSRFIDAVRDARSVAHAMGGHTWAAYQCYGDPDWHFRRESADPQRPGRALADEFGAVASTPGLLLALQTLTVRSEFQKPPNVEEHAAHLAAQRERIKYLEARFAPSWGTIGAVAEAFAAAWAAADDRDAAVRWYRKAIAANDGTASRKAVEQLGNLEVRAGWEDVHLARRRLDERPRAAVIASRRGRRNGKPAASTSRGPDAALAKAMAAARVRIGHGMALLTRLNTVQSTMEGESLIGSAYKRLAMIERLAGRGADERRALVKMQRHYARAEACGREQGLTGLYYPIMNRLAADLLLNAPRPGWKGLDQAALEDARVELAAINRDNPDFWSIISQTELAMYDAISGGELHDRLPAIARALRDLHARIGSASKWRSVYDQVELMLGGIPRGVGAEAKAMRELRGLLAAMAGVESATSASRRSRSRAVRR
jgi:hypothetical protein